MLTAALCCEKTVNLLTKNDNSENGAARVKVRFSCVRECAINCQPSDMWQDLDELAVSGMNTGAHQIDQFSIAGKTKRIISFNITIYTLELNSSHSRACALSINYRSFLLQISCCKQNNLQNKICSTFFYSFCIFCIFCQNVHFIALLLFSLPFRYFSIDIN